MINKVVIFYLWSFFMMPTSILFEDEVLTALESLTGLGLENFDDVQSHTNALSELRNKISKDGLSRET